MKEHEYINTKHLGHITSAKECLKHVTSQISEIIPDDEFEEVMKLISQWEIKLFKEFNETM